MSVKRQIYEIKKINQVLLRTINTLFLLSYKVFYIFNIFIFKEFAGDGSSKEQTFKKFSVTYLKCAKM